MSSILRRTQGRESKRRSRRCIEPVAPQSSGHKAPIVPVWSPHRLARTTSVHGRRPLHFPSRVHERPLIGANRVRLCVKFKQTDISFAPQVGHAVYLHMAGRRLCAVGVIAIHQAQFQPEGPIRFPRSSAWGHDKLPEKGFDRNCFRIGHAPHRSRY